MAISARVQKKQALSTVRFFPDETYNCTHYVEGNEYDYC